ncbi:Uncharacterised protein [Mycobacterium tuberculosis]|nr:Uncharacterised protein [Mycobacterium tuberculosis]CLA58913.1 Uncharacterised protein [Mycobacterium tuberculosis]CLA74663.1 Uncharacterised protein [Mycobacterium tuberculosis]
MNQHKEACAVARRSAYRHESDGPHVHAAAGTSAEAPQDTGICSSSCGNSCRSSGSGSSASVMFAPNGNNYPSAPWVPGGPILPWMPELPPGDPPAPPAPPLPPSAKSPP